MQLGIELVCAGADHTLGTNGCCHGGARGMVSCWYAAGVALRRGRVSAAGLMQGIGGKGGLVLYGIIGGCIWMEQIVVRG